MRSKRVLDTAGRLLAIVPFLVGLALAVAVPIVLLFLAISVASSP